MHALNNFRPKLTWCGSLSYSVKGGSKWLGRPSNWRIWNALCQSLCTTREVTTGLRLPSEGVGSVKHKVVLS